MSNRSSPLAGALAVLMILLAASACGSEPAGEEAVSGGEARPAVDPSLGEGPDGRPGARPGGSAPGTTAEQAGDGASGLPAVVTDEAGSVVSDESIERIIPLAGDVAEIVFALGLGENVGATDLSATYPPEADDLPEIGYQRALSAEPIAAFEPTVLLATDIAGPPEALDDLRRLGYPVVIVPNNPTPAGAGEKIRAIAAALGVGEQGRALAGELEDAIADATVEPDPDGPAILTLYLRGTAAQLVLGESYTTHWLIEAAGGVDVSSQLGVTDSEPISIEAVLRVAPDVLLVTDSGLESVGGVDGLHEITGLAAADVKVLAYDDQLLLGNGPRVAEMLARLVTDLSAIEAP
jgi:iron complex transport system substrate-binding protein